MNFVLLIEQQLVKRDSEKMIVQHNLLAMNANRQFNLVNDSKAKTTEKLASGYKINRAADDAAGLAISEKMRRQIRGLTQGVQNTMEGMSVCHVADGALTEVHDMLNRMEELSVKAANATLDSNDRSFIQAEISKMVDEIERISVSTTFNEIPIFKGKDTQIVNADGTPYIEGDIPFDDLTMGGLTLGNTPISSSGANKLAIQAVVNRTGSAGYGHAYNLIFGNGSTSQSKIRITYDGKPSIPVEFSSMKIANYSDGTDADGKKYWKRDFTYTNDDGVDITITQKVKENADDDKDKNFVVSYAVKNNGTVDVDLDFMFHADTAYNNNDSCEGYYINGNRVTNYTLYSKPGSKFNNGSANTNIVTGVPLSISIINKDEALSFAGKIQVTGNLPDSISVGRYDENRNWDYYDNLDSNLGKNAINQDLGFTMLWNDSLDQGTTQTYSLIYGISAADKDPNLGGVTITKSDKTATNHADKLDMWIQSGSEKNVGMYLYIDEMDTAILGIKDINVSTIEGALRAIDSIKVAQKKVSSNRSDVGAQENRLQHTVDNENNIVENTTAAESQIRDTDMATAMVSYSNSNILAQAGASVLAQANQSNQSVLGLLSQ